MLFGGILLGYVLYMKCGYIFQSNSSLGDPVLAISSSDSIPKLKEEIKALQQKFDVLQRRYVHTALEYISILPGAALRAKNVVGFTCIIDPHLGFGWNPSSLFGSTAGSFTWERQKMSKTRTR